MKKIVLCILDGFGYSEKIVGNAILEAKFINALFNKGNSALLDASETSVGLPAGQFGNSEVGHLTIGSGRILKQKLPLITDSITSGELAKNPDLINFLSTIQNNTCHIMGLFSNGGVHSDINHFFWAIQFLRTKNINIKAHLFLDGRDVGYRDALNTLKNAINSNKISLSEIATIQGRFYAMDRDMRLDRTEAAYEAIVNAKGCLKTKDPISAIQSFYDQDTNDEQIPQIILENYNGADKGDSFWMLNFRTDRIKQILNLLQSNNFRIMNMVNCDDEIDSKATILFKQEIVKNTLGEVLSNNKIKQLRIAETEKYAHVTYFFNGGEDVQYPLEDRFLINSPAVKDYATTPDMSAKEITNKLIETIKAGDYQVIIANFANADMVGHTGNFEATKDSINSLDLHIRDILQVAKNSEYDVILTSDHGNAEEMINSDLTPQKAHTCAKVPFIFVSHINVTRKTGELSDIAPTILKYLGINIPSEMTGTPLI